MEKAFGYRKNSRKVKSKYNAGRPPAVKVKSVKRGYSSRSGVSTGSRLAVWFRRIIMLAVVIALLFWQWSNIISFVNRLALGTFGLLGWGIVLVVIALLVILGIVFRTRLSAFARRYKLYLWNKWLGAAAVFFGLWGVLGLFENGGAVGQAIVGEYAVLNVLRVLGLFFLGFIFIAPGLSWRAFTAILRGFFGLFRAPPPRSRPVPASPGGTGRSALPVASSRFTVKAPAASAPPASGLAKQAPRPHEGGTILGVTPGQARPMSTPAAPEGRFSFFNKPKPAPSITPLPALRVPPETPRPEPVALRPEPPPAIRDTPVATPISIAPAALSRTVSPLKPQESALPARPPIVVQQQPSPIRQEASTKPAPVEGKVNPAAVPARAEPVRAAAPVISGDKPRVEPWVEAKTEPKAEPRQLAQDVWRKYGQAAGLTVVDGWKIPPIDILDKSQEVEYSEADNQQRAKVIEDALESYGVNAKVVQINVGPTVTQFGLEPGWDIKTKRVQERDEEGNITFRDEETSRTRVKVDRITSLANDLSLALSAPTIRIEAPVPGKPIVGIEVPNKIYSTVSLRGVMETAGFQKVLAKSHLAMALGKGAGGEAISDDLAKMPHLLIAGATGSGKTVCLNAVICCILMDNTPFDTKLILIDPKRVEMTQFNSLPHLATPVIVDTDKALATMRWLNAEMDARYKKLAAAGARNIDGFNKNKNGADKMPNLVLVIDELADLMMAGFDEVEHILCRLAQLARAVGIHLVVATQRPSVDVITGLIKANFPTRISFAVTSQVDSRTILDMVGAEKLLGRGDMLFAPTEAAKPKRLQGCYVSDPEVERLVYFWNSQKREDVNPVKIDDMVMAMGRKEGPAEDQLMETVRKLAKEHEQISSSFLQRKLGIGYPRAARLFDRYKEEIGPNKDGGAETPPEE